MPGKDTAQVVVGANGTVSVAPVGTAAPTNTATALNAAFVDLGYTTEDGFKFSQDRKTEDIRVWQSFYPARKIVTELNVQVSFSLAQWAKATVEFALAGTVTSPGANEWKLVPNAPETVAEKAMVIEWLDGTKKYRLYIAKGVLVENNEFQVNRTSAAELPVTFAAIGQASVDAFTVFSNDPAFAGT